MIQKDKNDEKILVVPAEIIFAKGKWRGLERDKPNYYLDLIRNNYQFKRRGDVEDDPSFQQIIPYIVFNCETRFFIYKYLPQAGESRLVDTYQIGIGGHINESDVNGANDVLEEGMMREWSEEVNYSGGFLEKKFIGLLNDDTNPVEQVHLGLVYNFVGGSPEISIRETDKMAGELVELKDIAEKIKNNDGIWIKIVYDQYLKNLLR